MAKIKILVIEHFTAVRDLIKKNLEGSFRDIKVVEAKSYIHHYLSSSINTYAYEIYIRYTCESVRTSFLHSLEFLSRICKITPWWNCYASTIA